MEDWLTAIALGPKTITPHPFLAPYIRDYTINSVFIYINFAHDQDLETCEWIKVYFKRHLSSAECFFVYVTYSTNNAPYANFDISPLDDLTHSVEIAEIRHVPCFSNFISNDAAKLLEALRSDAILLASEVKAAFNKDNNNPP